MTNAPYDLSTPMDLAKTLTVYEDLRGVMPVFNTADKTAPLYADKLSDLFEHFDALLLDGFGVLNVGADPVPGANQMLAMARQNNILPMVLTNGASKNSDTASVKYHNLGLDIHPRDVLSSRDALLDHLTHDANEQTVFGVVDSFTDVPKGIDMQMVALTPDRSDDWLTCGAIGFFGAVDWTDAWQAALMKAISAGVTIKVANPDVAAPLPNQFSREPAFWVAKALHDLNMSLPDAKVEWFGKPYAPVFDLAVARLEARIGHSNLNHKRIAMVGDTLHTDILGGHAAGLSTVLVTGHGLFRDGGAEDTITSVGITPDYIVKTV